MAKLRDSSESVVTAEQEPSVLAAPVPNHGEHGSSRELSGAAIQSPTPRPSRKVLLTTLAVGLVALVVLVGGIGKPPIFVFDELYYVPAARAILHGSLNMDPGEPPMGKLLMAIGMKAAGDNSFGWRVSGGVCGALSVVAVFLWTQLLFAEYRISVYAAAFTLLNNILFVMSRIAMMDVYLVFFVMWAMLACTAAFLLRTSIAKRRILVCCAGILFGLGGACKWNAIDTLAALLVIGLATPLLLKFVRVPSTSPLPRFVESLRSVRIPTLLFALVLLPAVSYSLVYWFLYRAIVHLPFGFQDLVQQNYIMWSYHHHDGVLITMFHHWYEWPFLATPARALSYLMGNPVVMWAGFAGILFCLWRSWKSFGVSEGLVALLYAANLLQWAVTPSRGAYYYYYLPSAMFLGVALAYTVHCLPRTFFRVRIGVVLMAAAVVVFVWCYPRMAHLDAPWDCALGCWN